MCVCVCVWCYLLAFQIGGVGRGDGLRQGHRHTSRTLTKTINNIPQKEGQGLGVE